MRIANHRLLWPAPNAGSDRCLFRDPACCGEPVARPWHGPCLVGVGRLVPKHDLESPTRGCVGMRRTVMAALIVLCSVNSAYAQSMQVWPEVGAYTRLNDTMRFYFLATTVKENKDSTEGEFGPNFDFYHRPLRNPTRFSGLPLDESKHRFLLLRVGYRYLHSFSDDPDEHRAVLEATARYPLVAGLLVSNRGRMDLRFIGAENSWRFRNRLSVEKELAIGRVRMTPYARGEVYYDSRFAEWSRTEWIGGAAFPLRKRLELEGYFSYQNDTSGDVNRQVSAIGAVLNLYFLNR